MAELNLMVSDTQVGRKQAQMNIVELSICTMRIFLIMCTNISMQCGFPGYCCNPSITLLDSNQIFHISILDWNYSIKILQLNKITQEGRKKWTSLFEPHEHRASRDLHPVYDWWLNKSLTRISVLHWNEMKSFRVFQVTWIWVPEQDGANQLYIEDSFRIIVLQC